MCMHVCVPSFFSREKRATAPSQAQPKPNPKCQGRRAPFLLLGSEQATASLEEVPVEDLSVLPGSSQVISQVAEIHRPAFSLCRAPKADFKRGQTGGPVVRNLASHAGAPVPSLVWELRSCMLYTVAKINTF